MILDDILGTLKNDEELNILLESTVKDSKIHMFKAKEGIAYKWVPLTSDGIKSQSRLEITVIHSDYETAYNILARIKNLLITIGDTQFNSRMLSITQNGGGTIENEDTHSINMLCFFVVNSRI